MPQRDGKIFRYVILGDGGNLTELGACQRAVVRIAQDEKTGGKGCFGAERAAVPLTVCPLFIGGRHGTILRGDRRRGKRDRTLIALDELKRLRQVGVDGNVVCRVDNDRQQQHDRRDRKRGDADEAVAQPTDHTPSSST